MPANKLLDRLIHSKVMGQPLDVPCTQEHNLIDGEYWRCVCGWKSTDLDHTEHFQQIPAYSTDLNEAHAAAAQKFVIVRLQTVQYSKPEHQVTLHTNQDGIKDKVTKHSTEIPMARLLCEAMLEAYGVEIESDHAN